MDNVQNAVNLLSDRYTIFRGCNVHNTANPLSGISMNNIQSTANLSRHCIQFSQVEVHNNTSSLYPLDISSTTQVAEYIILDKSGITLNTLF